MISDYNAGSRNIEQLFNELLQLSQSLSQEQERHVREGLSEEQLVIFDILLRPAPELSPEEVNEIKKVAKSLLEVVRSRLVLNWREKQQARAGMMESIRSALDDGLPNAFTPEIYEDKCQAVFQHVYESYSERDINSYAN